MAPSLFFCIKSQKWKISFQILQKRIPSLPKMPQVKGEKLAAPLDFIFVRLSLSLTWADLGQLWEGRCQSSWAKTSKMQLVTLHNLCQAVCTQQKPHSSAQTPQTTEGWSREHPMKLSGKKYWTNGGKYFFTQHVIELWTLDWIVEVPVAGCAGAQADPAPAGVSRAPGGWELAGGTSKGWAVPGRKAGEGEGCKTRWTQREPISSCAEVGDYFAISLQQDPE